MPLGLLPAVGTVNSVMTPALVIRPILLALLSVNQRLPSDPAAMAFGPLAAPIENSVMTPAVVIRPILLPLLSVNQRFPSGPAAMPYGKLPAVGIVNSVTPPVVVIRPILLPALSVNQRLPSGPAAIPMGLLPAATGDSATEPAALATRSPATTPPVTPVSDQPSGVTLRDEVVARVAADRIDGQGAANRNIL